MTLVLWIVLGLLAWALVPLPLALLVGRILRRGEQPTVEPVEARHTQALAPLDA